jgi:hypothetical protein
MNLPYTGNIPDPPHNPATDVPDMQENTNSIQTWVTIDHYGFNTSGATDGFGGLHSQVRMPTLGTAKPTLVNGAGNLYVNTINGNSELLYIPDNTGDVYQLTSTSHAQYAIFADDTNYPQTPPVATQFGGWTFLPGGLLLQYGNEQLPGSSNPDGIVKFPRAFSSSVFNLQLTLNANSTTNSSNTISSIGTPTKTQFKWNFTGSTSYNYFYWMAIGF